MTSRELVGLCARMQQGDQSAFESLYQECYTPLYRFVYGMVFSKEETEDIVQETFVRVAKAIRTFKNSSENVFGWLFTIARNLVYDRSRRSKRTTPLLEEHENMSDTTNIEEDFLREEESRQLMNVVKTLRDTERELIVLRYWSDLDLKQISVILGKSHEAVRKEMSRILKKLREATHDGYTK